MPYGQIGAHQYLTDQLSIASDRTRLIIAAGNNVVGYIEFHNPAPSIVSIDYLAVARTHRRLGFGSRLISTAASTATNATIRLDVLTSNDGALAFYRRKGFVPVGSKSWLTRRLAPPNSHVSHDNAESEQPATMALGYGFSRVGDWTHKGHTVPIGRLGNGIVRVYTESALFDDTLLAALHSQYPDAREAFAIFTTGRLQAAAVTGASLKAHFQVLELTGASPGGLQGK
ncbi:GNAT family N-acetyltransferase [Georgenia sunbinii]|uniref:GNAT family N-acetyltransferase n=1 Tax=Georgenia sunbinii TaxID=3117728 RepID=UPI003D9C6536